MNTRFYGPDLINLKDHGDSHEMRFVRFLSDRVPIYERFWIQFVAPLTFRVLDPYHKPVRPSIPDELKGLVNTSYAVMWHLTWAADHNDQLNDTDHSDRVQRTRLLYAFFCHSRSLFDALGYFAKAVDRISSSNGPFGAVYNSFKARWEFTSSRKRTARVAEEYIALKKQIGQYRNTVVHECPIYVINDRMPSEHELWRYSGLTALADAVKRGVGSATAFVWISKKTADFKDRMVSVASYFWDIAYCCLSNQLRYEELACLELDKDSDMTREKFEEFFKMFGDQDR